VEVKVNEWEPLLVDPNGIVVNYQEKYGLFKTVDCIGIWYSKKLRKYRLTWKTSKAEEIPECNINSIGWTRKDEV
jgi:hypothetical protein